MFVIPLANVFFLF